MATVPKHLTEIIEKIKKNEVLEESRNKEVNEILLETSKLREENARLSDLLLEKEMEREELLIKCAVKKEAQNFKELEKKLVFEARQKWIKMTEDYEVEKDKAIESRWNERRAYIASIKSKIEEIKSKPVDEEESSMLKQLLLGTLGKPPEPEVIEPTRSPLRSPLLGEKPTTKNLEIEEEFIDLEIMQQIESLADWPVQNVQRSEDQPAYQSQNPPLPKSNPKFGPKNSNYSFHKPNFGIKPSQKSNLPPNTQKYNFSPNKNQNSQVFAPKSLNFNAESKASKSTELNPKSTTQVENTELSNSDAYFLSINPAVSNARGIQTARSFYEAQNSTRTSSFQFKKPQPRNPQASNTYHRSTWQNQEDDFDLIDAEDSLISMDSSVMDSYPKTNPPDSNSYQKSNKNSNKIESRKRPPSKIYQKSSPNSYIIDLTDSNAMDCKPKNNSYSNQHSMDSKNPPKSYKNIYSKSNYNQMDSNKPMDSNPKKPLPKTYSNSDMSKYLNDSMSKSPLDSNIYSNSMDSYNNTSESYDYYSDQMDSTCARVPSNSPFRHSQDSAFYSAASPSKIPSTAKFEEVPPRKSKFVPKQATFNQSK